MSLSKHICLLLSDKPMTAEELAVSAGVTMSKLQPALHGLAEGGSVECREVNSERVWFALGS